LMLKEGKIIPIQERVDVVNEMFQMARSGHGYEQIAKLFNVKGYRTFAKAKGWRPAGIQSVIKNRALIGEFQPHIIQEGVRVPDGDPILEYYPTVVSPAIFDEVQHIIGKRNNHSGSYRKGLYNNLFSGVIRCQCGELLRYQNKGSKAQARNYLVCPMQGVTGCQLPYLLYSKLEPQLLKALSMLTKVMGQRRPISDKTLALKDDLAVLRSQLESETKKRAKAAQSMLDFDDDTVFRALFEQYKVSCQALAEKIRQVESDILRLQLSNKTIHRLLHPEDLSSTEQRQQFNTQLKSAVKIEIFHEYAKLVAVFRDLEDEVMLEQAFESKLAGSTVLDFDGHICVKTIADAPYIDPDWAQEEEAEYARNSPDPVSGIDNEFGEYPNQRVEPLTSKLKQ